MVPARWLGDLPTGRAVAPVICSATEKEPISMRLLLLLGALIGCANAEPVTWYIHSVHYSAGTDNLASWSGYPTGWFTYDADTSQLLDWSISDPSGPPSPYDPFWGVSNYPAPFTWSPSSAGSFGTVDDNGSRFFVEGGDRSGLQIFVLFFDVPLSDAGNPTPIIPFNLDNETGSEALRNLNAAVSGRTPRFIEAGAFVSTDGPSLTPEPSTFMLVALSSLAALRFRAKRP